MIVSKKKPAWGRLWFDWHSWLGIMGGLLLFLICWSGAFAVLSHEIDWLLTPTLRVSPDGEAADLAAIQGKLKAAMPETRLIAVFKPLGPRFAAVGLVSTAARQTRLVYVDPYRLEITGTASVVTVQRVFREFHQDLFGLYGAGKYLVCLLSVPLLLSLVTALLFYKRWWRRFFELRAGRGPRAFWSSLHKVAGLWSLWFVPVIALTGFWYLFEHARYHLVDGKFAYVDAYPLAVHPLPALPSAGERMTFAALLDAAQSARPDLDIRAAYSDRKGYFYVVGQAGDPLVRDRSNSLFLDPRDGRVAYSQRPGDLSAYWQWSDMADPLHFGNFAGLPVKLLWFLFGVALSGLSLTGAWLHVKRLRRDDTMGQGWRGTVLAAGVAVALPLCAIPSIWAFLKRAGPLVEGARTMPDIPTGIALFLVAWTAATLTIMALWLFGLSRAKPGPRGASLSRRSDGCP